MLIQKIVLLNFIKILREQAKSEVIWNQNPLEERFY